jgi:hypothetical protein
MSVPYAAPVPDYGLRYLRRKCQPNGYQPPDGARALKPRRRAFYAWRNPACRAVGDAKLVALNTPNARPRSQADPATDPALAKAGLAPRTPRHVAAQTWLI